MNQRISTLVIFTALLQVIVAQGVNVTPLLAGENHFSLKLNGSGYANLPTSLNNYIQNSFTIELWFLSEAVSVYQPLVSHGLNGQWNSHIDFNLQVSAKGILSFFMGNGESSSYGFNIAGPVVTRNVWHHVAVAVEHDQADYNPRRARLFLDGQIVAEQPWIGGNRQLIGTPISIGWFDNTDPGFQTFYGNVDEVRVWDSFRTPAQIMHTLDHRVTPEESVNLVAYYRFEEPYATTLYDETEDFDAVPYNVEWDTAGKAFPAYYTIDSTNRAFYIVDLPYSDYIQQSMNFTITALPNEATLFAVDAYDNVQHKILTVPFTLTNNKVAFLWEFYLTEEVFTCEYEISTASEVSSANLVFNLLEGLTCDGLQGSVVDSCGICGGDDSDCQCVWGPGYYKGFGLSELDKIMAFYSVETTLQLLQQLQGNLVLLDQQLESCKNDSITVDLSLASALDVFNNFHRKALNSVVSTAEDVQNIARSV